ncbi:hypothetical protein ACFL0H_04905 [Thermodesulfobacteriota bacterium]
MTWFISILFIIIKGSLVNNIFIKPLDIDIIIVIIVYLLIFYGETGAGIFAFGQGLITDIFSGGMLGLFALLYLIVFLCIKLASHLLNLLSTGCQMAVITMAVLLKEVLMAALLHLFPLEITFTFNDFLLFAFSAICSGLVAPFIFYFLDFLNRLFMEADEDA